MNLLVTGMVFCGLLSAQTPLKILTVHEPPQSFEVLDNESLSVQGYAVEIVRALQNEVGDSTKIELLPEARVLKRAELEENVFFFSFSKTKERAEQYRWVLPLMKVHWTFFSLKKDSIDVESLKEITELGLIGSTQGDVRSLWLEEQKGAPFEKARNHAQNVKKLLSGRVATVLYDAAGLVETCKELGCKFEDFTPLWVPKATMRYLVMSKNGSDLDLFERWQKVGKKLIAEGTVEKISQKWVAILNAENPGECKVEDGFLSC